MFSVHTVHSAHDTQYWTLSSDIPTNDHYHITHNPSIFYVAFCAYDDESEWVKERFIMHNIHVRTHLQHSRFSQFEWYKWYLMIYWTICGSICDDIIENFISSNAFEYQYSSLNLHLLSHHIFPLICFCSFVISSDSRTSGISLLLCAIVRHHTKDTANNNSCWNEKYVTKQQATNWTMNSHMDYIPFEVGAEKRIYYVRSKRMGEKSEIHFALPNPDSQPLFNSAQEDEKIEDEESINLLI